MTELETMQRAKMYIDKLAKEEAKIIAEYFGVDPTVVRAIYVILTFCTAFSGVLAYLILLLIIPERRNQIR